MSKKIYFSSYKSPNICIVPSESICYPPSPKRPKLDIPPDENSPQKNIDLSFLDDFDVDEIIDCLNDCEGNAQNALKQSNNENNYRQEKDCSESSLELSNNEGNEVKPSIIEEDLIQNINKQKKQIPIEKKPENIITDISLEKEIKVSSQNDIENEHSKVYVVDDDSERFIVNSLVLSPNNKQPNDVTYKTIGVSSLDNISTNKVTNHTQDLLSEKITEKCLLQTEQELSGKVSKPFKGDGNDKKEQKNTLVKNIIEIKISEENNLQSSNNSERQDEQKTSVSEDESTKDNFKTVEIKENNNIHINNKNNVKAQKATEKEQVELYDVAKLHTLLFPNLEKVMFQYIHKKCSVLSLVHSGKFSKIFKCKDSTGEQYAIKMIKKNGNGCRQKCIMSTIREDIPKENLLCVYLIAGFYFNHNWYYITEFYSKNLKDVLKESKKNMHIDTIQVLAGQLVGAITTLRNKNIVHSDINPSHILLDSTNTKLRVCGFDEAYYIQTANLSPYKGTGCYRAPEVILGFSAGFSLDVWSTALVLHEMATGIQLFGGCVDDQVLYKQMCILGDVPSQMLLRSRYRYKFVMGHCVFKGKCLRHKQNSMVNTKNKIACTIQGAYYSHWAEGKNQKQISKDMQKIRQFIRLLDQMLVIYPVRRLPIEFAYANPFIHKVFSP